MNKCRLYFRTLLLTNRHMWVFIISLFFTLLILLFLANFAKSVYDDNSKYLEDEYAIVVETNGSMSNIKDTLESFCVENECYLKHAYVKMTNDDEQTVYANIIGDFPNEYVTLYGRNFYDEELVEGERVALLPLYSSEIIDSQYMYNVTDTNMVGDEYSINGTLYRAIGISSHNIVVIPYNSINKHAIVTSVKFIPSNDITYAERNILISSIRDVFKSNIVMIGKSNTLSAFVNESSGKTFLIIALLIAACIFNIRAILSNALEASSNQILTYKLCGASSWWIYLNILVKFVFCFTPLYCIAFGLNKLVAGVWLSDMWLFSDNYDVGFFLLLYILVLLFYLLIMFPVMKNISQKSINSIE